MIPKQKLVEENAALQAQIAELKAQLEEKALNRELAAQVAELERAKDSDVGDIPIYRLNGPVFVAHTYIPEGFEIGWLGEPNSEMVPMNQAARDRWDAFLKSQEEDARAAAKRVGAEFEGLTMDRDELAARAVEFERIAEQKKLPRNRKKIVVPTLKKGDAPQHGAMEGRNAWVNRQKEMLVSIKEPPPMPRPGLAGMAGGMDFGIPVGGSHQVFGA